MLNEELQNKCGLFEDNYQTLRKNFKWEYASMNCLGALLYANADQVVNVQAIKDSKDIIKKHTGFFSSFKDTAFFAMAVMLSLEPDGEELFLRTVKVYEEMKKAGFYSSVYLTLAAYSIAKKNEYSEDPIICRAKEFYDAMKKEHRFLTSTDDYGYAAMLATTDLSVDTAITEMETCYELLKKDFGSGNALQSLTPILAMGEEPAADKCKRAKKIYETLVLKGCKLSKYNQIASLGILVLISEDVEKITEEVSEAYHILLTKKGFGTWSMTKHERTMYASALVTAASVGNLKQDTMSLTLTNSLTNIIVAQQTAMMIAAASAGAAAASSSSGN